MKTTSRTASRFPRAARRSVPGRRPPKRGKMNRAEAQYEAFLKCRKDVAAYLFEPLSLRLVEEGGRCRYEPDFLLKMADGTNWIVDVKAQWRNGKVHIEDDALVKMKVVAEKFRVWFRVKIVWWDRLERKWKEREF